MSAKHFKPFGAFLKQARLKQKLSQSELAKILGYQSPQFVSNWECGRSGPPLDSLVKISEVLKIPQSKIMEFFLQQAKLQLENRFETQSLKKADCRH